MAKQRAAEDPGGTRRPFFSGSISSAGPQGQSALTTGRPQAMASHRALGKPSYRDESTNRSAFRRIAPGFRTVPRK